MQYFTNEWWASGCQDNLVFEKYQNYLSSVSARLPEQLLQLYNEYTLHDANIKEIDSNFVDNTITIKLLGWDIKFTRKVRYMLFFSGVTKFEQILPPEEYVEEELGDLGYYEYEALERGTEMRMLFASGAQFTINFHEFKFTYEEYN